MALDPNIGNLSEYLSESNNLLEEVKVAVEDSEIDITTLSKEAKQDDQIVLETAIKDAILALQSALPLPNGAATQTTLAALLTSTNLLAKLTDTQPIINKNDYLSDVALGIISGVLYFNMQGVNSCVRS